MQILTFFVPVLEKLNDGKVIRTSIAFALQILGYLTLLGFVVLLVTLLKGAFQLPGAGATIGGVLFAFVLAATGLAIYQILIYRAGNIRDLAESPFTVIPIFSILFRIAGEVYSVIGLAVGVGGCLFIWLAQLNPMYLLGGIGSLLPSLSPEGTFLGGILFLIYLSVASFFVLIIFYFLAEASVVMVDVAKNIRLLLKQATGSSD
jgi:hypothetical protein